MRASVHLETSAGSREAAQTGRGRALAVNVPVLKDESTSLPVQDDDSKSDFHSLLNKYHSSSSGDDDDDSNSGDSKDQTKKKDPSRMLAVPVHVLQPLPEVLPLLAQNPLKTVEAQSSVYTADVQNGAAAETEAPSSDPAPSGEQQRTSSPQMEADDETRTSSSAPMAFAAKLTPTTGENAGGENAGSEDAGGAAPRDTQSPAPASPAPAPQKAAAAPEVVSGDADPAPAKAGADAAIEKFVKIDTPAPADSPILSDAPIKKEAAPNISATERMQPLIEAPAAPSGSNHDITVRLPDAAERAIDVRFVDRGGEVHVSVRTGDAEAAQTLRSGLSDFVGKMDHAGIRAEVWRPGADASSAQNNSQNNQNSSSDPRDQRGSGRNSSGAQDRDEQQRSNKPKWVEALENAAEQAA